jgi:hypothetical protein
MSSIIPASVLRQELRVARKSPDHYNKFAHRFDNDVANSIRRGYAAGDDHPAREPGVAA